MSNVLMDRRLIVPAGVYQRIQQDSLRSDLMAESQSGKKRRLDWLDWLERLFMRSAIAASSRVGVFLFRPNSYRMSLFLFVLFVFFFSKWNKKEIDWHCWWRWCSCFGSTRIDSFRPTERGARCSVGCCRCCCCCCCCCSRTRREYGSNMLLSRSWLSSKMLLHAGRAAVDAVPEFRCQLPLLLLLTASASLSWPDQLPEPICTTRRPFSQTITTNEEETKAQNTALDQ